MIGSFSTHPSDYQANGFGLNVDKYSCTGKTSATIEICQGNKLILFRNINFAIK